MLTYRSTAACPSILGGQTFKVAGPLLCGDPALPRPLILTARVEHKHAEVLAASVLPSRLSVVALSGDGAEEDALLARLAADLRASGSAMSIFEANGGMHFLLPGGDAASRVLANAAVAAHECPTAYMVSVLLTDAAAQMAALTMEHIVAAGDCPLEEGYNEEESSDEV
jgi:hypothetical protein